MINPTENPLKALKKALRNEPSAKSLPCLLVTYLNEENPLYTSLTARVKFPPDVCRQDMHR